MSVGIVFRISNFLYFFSLHLVLRLSFGFSLIRAWFSVFLLIFPPSGYIFPVRI